MAVAITQLTPTDSFKPRFFAYGQFPLYLAYGSFQAITNAVLFFKSGSIGGAFFKPIPLSDAIYYLRFFSALASVVTMIIMYQMSKLFFPSVKTRALVLLFVAITPGLIQNAHFGTTESILTFLFMAILYMSLKLIATKGQPFRGYFGLIPPVFLLGFLVGLASSVKLTGLYFAIPAIFGLIYFFRKKPAAIIVSGCIFLEVAIGAYIFGSPYNLLAKNEFLSTIRYETSVATGVAQVFYTRQFPNTTALLFQLTRVFPYTTALPLFILGVTGFTVSLIRFIRARNITIFVILVSFMSYFIGNGLLFAKWNRFMTPIFPLFALFAGFVFERLLITKTHSVIKNIIIGSFIATQLFFGLLFFSIYIRADTRIAASKWIFANIPDKSYILSETANVVDIPVSSSNFQFSNSRLKQPLPNYTVISFNFYYLDEQPELVNELINHLEKADYIFIPSRRIFANHLRTPEKYPLLNKYYQALFDGRLGFEKIAEINPNLNFQLSDEAAEETFTVFDHPTIRIFKKVAKHDNLRYQQILKNLNTP